MNNKKSEKEWEKILSPDQYRVLRRKGTERPYTGEYNNHFEKGNYKCSACGKELFKSENKFKSNCGWPSFESAIKDSVKEIIDYSHGMIRTRFKELNKIVELYGIMSNHVIGMVK